MRLVLSRLEPRDLDAIVPIFYKAFRGFDMAYVFFGRESPASFAYLKRKWLEGMETDPADVFLKIEDLDAEEVDVNLMDEAGNTIGTRKRKRIVCASNWKVFPTYVPPKRNSGVLESSGGDKEANGHSLPGSADKSEVPFGYLDREQERADAAIILNDFTSRRQRACQEGHVLCFILFTDPEYHGKGAGRLMMQWGNDLADSLMLPIWIEASAHGEFLYRKMGFEEVERVDLQTETFRSQYTHMRRPLKVRQVEAKDGLLVRG